MQTVIVLGASGFIGRHVVDRIKGQRTVVASLRSVPEPMFASGVAIDRDIEKALSQGTDLSAHARHLLGTANFVIDLAANPRYGNGTEYKLDVERVRRLIRLLEDVAPQLERFVFASSLASVERADQMALGVPITEDDLPAPRTDYGRAKLLSERLVLESTIPASVLRLGWVVGPDMRSNSHAAVISRFAAKWPRTVHLPLAGVAPIVHVNDVCSAIDIVLASSDAAGKIFNVAAENVPISEIFAIATSRPDAHLLPALPDRMVRILPYAAKALLTPVMAMDSTRLRSIGWEPAISGRDAIREVADREHGRLNPAEPPDGIAVVTGAASGLGLAAARRLRSDHRHLLLIDLPGSGLENVAKELDALYVTGDVTDPDLLPQLFGIATEAGMRITEAWLCAGVGYRGQFGSEESGREMAALSVNLEARVQWTRLLARHMRSSGFGRIILVASSSAFVPMPLFAVYAASNAGVLSFGAAIAEELRPLGVDVLTVCPSGMATSFQQTAGVKTAESERLLEPEQVVDRVTKSLRHRQSVLLIGASAHSFNMAAKFLPRRLLTMLLHHLAARYR